MSSFQFSKRGILLAVLITFVAISLIQYYLDRIEFANIKAETAQKIAAKNWEPASRKLLDEALEQVAYGNRQAPRLVVASIHESYIDSKVELGNGQLMSANGVLSVGWFDLKSDVDTIRINLNNNSYVDHHLNGPTRITDLFHYKTLFLGSLRVASHREVESVVLISKENLISKPISPKHIPIQNRIAE